MWFLKKKKTDPGNTTGRDDTAGQDKTLGETLRSLKKLLAEKDIPASEPTASNKETQKTPQQQTPPPQGNADPSPADRALRDKLDPTTTTWHDLSLDFDAEPLRPATPGTSVPDASATSTDAGEETAQVNGTSPAPSEPPAADTETDLAGNKDPDVIVEDPQAALESDKDPAVPETDAPGEDSAGSLEPSGQQPRNTDPPTLFEGRPADENIPTLEDIVYIPGDEANPTEPANDADPSKPVTDAADIAAQTDQLVTLLRLRMGLGGGVSLSAAQEAVLRTTLVEFLQRRRSTDRH